MSQADQQDWISQTPLAERYLLAAEIRRGPTASVYRGTHRESGKPVAVKIFQERYRDDPRFAIRFRELLKVLAGINHENLIAIRDYGFCDGQYYLVMEWVEGADLGTFLAERGRLPPWRASTIARRVCAALEAVHQAGLIHRGIKPQNILISTDGHVKVTDVGSGGLVSESGLSKTNVMLGSVSYISPEQARAETIGPESDLYSLGVTVFEMLTGRLPFESNDAWSLVRMHARSIPPSPRRLNPQVPDDLARLVSRALEKDPARRFGSAREMEAALVAVQTNDNLATDENLMEEGRTWFSTMKAAISPDALRSLLLSPIRVRPLRWTVPFGVILALQFALSYLIALIVLYLLLFR